MAHPQSLKWLLVLLLWSTSGCLTPEESVYPLSIGDQNRCTTFKINEQAGYWITAGHCVTWAAAHELSLSIHGTPAQVFYLAPAPNDVALLQAWVTGPSLKLSHQAPRVRDEVWLLGYPYGTPRLLTTTGVLSARAVMVPDRIISDISTATGAPGTSGSPLLNRQGLVIGLVWGYHLNEHYTATVPWETLVSLVGAYWDADHSL